MSMDPGMLADLDAIAAGNWRTLLIDHARLSREVERLREDSRIQGVILADVGEALGAGAEESPVDAARRVRGERDDARGKAETLAIALSVENGKPEARLLWGLELEQTCPEASRETRNSKL